MSHKFPGNWILAHVEIARLNPNTTTNDAGDLQLFKEYYGENLPASAPSNVGFKWYDQSNNDNLKRPKLAEKTGRGQRRILPEPQWQGKVGTSSTSRSVRAEPSVSKSTTNKMDTWRTIKLDAAQRYVVKYNSGSSHGQNNCEIDRQARALFAGGLGGTYDEVLRQVKFIGDDYAGVSGLQRGAISSQSPAIADDIFRSRAQYEKTATEAEPISQRIASRDTIDILYSPFTNKPYKTSSNWLTWGSKFWHFLNPDAFPIADSRVKGFFDLGSSVNSVDLYLEVMKRFREFSLSHQDWIPSLRQVDDKCSCPAWNDNKLWDKMCYGSGEK